MKRWELQEKWGRELGCNERYMTNSREARTDLNNAWSDICSLDGAHSVQGGWSSFLQVLDEWMKERPSRQFRLFHTQGLLPPDPKINNSPIFARLRESGFTYEHQ
jgi:hypothetical protein